MNHDSRYRLIGLAIIAVSIITLVIIIQTIQNLTKKDINIARENIKEQAIALFDNMVTIRYWSASHGGVYVRQTPGLEPNPYLENGTVKTESGETLILINPAWMTRQIFEYLRTKKDEKHYYKITSPDPVNPGNAPDKFEAQAFNYFKENPSERYYFYFPENEPDYLFFMGLLRTEKACIACHKNARVGEIRGGIRISIPISGFREKERFMARQSTSLILLISFLALLTGILAFYLIRILMSRRREIEEVNDELERRVEERTLKITKMHHQETHLRKIMQTIANVNKEIINFHSIESLLLHVSDILSSYEENKFCCIYLGKKSSAGLKFYSASTLESEIKKNIEKYLLKHDSRISRDESIFSRKIVIEQELKSETDLSKMLLKAGINSLASFPFNHTRDKKNQGGIFVFSSVKNGFSEEEIRMLEELSGDLGFAIDSYNKQKYITRLKSERLRNFEETILSLIHLIEERDSYTAGHSVRVANYCGIIGKAMNLSQMELQKLEKASILHDLGKVATPDSILLRPGKLSRIEYDLVKLHVKSGYDVLKNVKIYKDLAEIVKYHHERHDGTGYPFGVSGENIPFLSRILSIADAFDAMTTDRVYHIRLNKHEALEEIRKNSSTQFHPEIAKAAIAALEKAELQKISFKLPQTELEQKRFAYFFNDRLTELYNEDYFFIVIQDNEKIKSYSNIGFISLKNFSQFNKKAGWDQGDELLKRFAGTLKSLFIDSMIFRVQGDDFIIISHDHTKVIKTKLEKIEYLKDYGMSFELNSMSVPRDFSLKIDKKSLSQLFIP